MNLFSHSTCAILLFVGTCSITLSSCGSNNDDINWSEQQQEITCVKTGNVLTYTNRAGNVYFFKILDNSQKIAITWDRINGEKCSDASCRRYSGDLTVPSIITCNEDVYTVTQVDDNAFYGSTNLTSITLPSTVTTLGQELFVNCDRLTSATLGDGITGIGDKAFYYCTSLTTVKFGSSVGSIGEKAFYGCSSLKSLTLPDDITTIGAYAFYDCSALSALTLGSKLTSIGESAFRKCSSLESIKIPSLVTSVGDYAFNSCIKLTYVWLGSSLKSIGQFAFTDCGNIATIYSLSTTPPTCSDRGVFSSYTATLNVPGSSISTYSATQGWSSFSNIQGF